MTTVLTNNLVRDDLPEPTVASDPGAAPTTTSRLWAVSGLAAAVTGIGAIAATAFLRLACALMCLQRLNQPNATRACFSDRLGTGRVWPVAR